MSQRQPQYVSGTPSLPSRFQHQRPMALGIMSPNVTHPTGNHQYPDHVNSQFAQQKYAPQVAMGQGIIHPSRLLENNHDLGDDSSTINPEPFGRHWQNLDSVSPSLERETLSRESELQDHKYVLRPPRDSLSDILPDLLRAPWMNRTRLCRI